jgi:RND family efflux transporter MFP subunit
MRQIILAAAVIAGTFWAWAQYVPSAAPYLERMGLAEILGVETGGAEQDQGRRWGGGGPVAVVAAPVTEGVIDDRIEVIGDARARRSVTLRAEVTGRITELPLAGGEYVEAGTVVLRLDDETQRIALERARLVHAEAEADAERLEQLGDTGAVTEVRLREARLALRTARLALDEAEYNLDRRTLRAPISGWIGVLDIAEGDRVSADDVIATITDRATVMIDFRVPARVVGQVAIGTPLAARPLGVPDLRLEGVVTAVDTVVDSTSRTLRVQGEVANEEDRLRAGMAFAVTLRFPGAVLPAVDPLSVQWSADGSFVWAVRDGKAVPVPVAIRQRDADRVIVEAALEPGDLVVTEGVQSLRPGADVTVNNAGDDAQAALAAPQQL